MKNNTLHDRLLAVAGHMTFASLGSLTDTHPETVRRYMRGQTPNPEFLAALSTEMGVNGDWLLTGRGQMWHGGKAPKGFGGGEQAAPRAGKKAAKKAGKKKAGKKAGKKKAGRRR